ncbi:hypothetical protein SUGI_0687550 [Cryptomeria japonica]|nr:hypothetical protein SUGI_0687550 [Cryptomeria japonica]
MPRRVGRYVNQRDRERRELQRRRLILWVREEWQAMIRLRELVRLRRIERARMRRGMCEIWRRIRLIEEVMDTLNSISTTQNNFLETAQPEVVSQQMKREATELIGYKGAYKLSDQILVPSYWPGLTAAECEWRFGVSQGK